MVQSRSTAWWPLLCGVEHTQHDDHPVIAIVLDAVDQDVVGAHDRLTGAGHAAYSVKQKTLSNLLGFGLDRAVDLDGRLRIALRNVFKRGFPVFQRHGAPYKAHHFPACRNAALRSADLARAWLAGTLGRGSSMLACTCARNHASCAAASCARRICSATSGRRLRYREATLSLLASIPSMRTMLSSSRKY